MKNSKSPHRPPEISPEKPTRQHFFPSNTPQVSCVRTHKSHARERNYTTYDQKTIQPHGSGHIFPHYSREKYRTISPQHIFRTQKIRPGQYTPANTPQTIRHKQYAPDNKTPRNTRKEAPAPHGTGASPTLWCSANIALRQRNQILVILRP